MQLNAINKGLKTNIEVVTRLSADCLSWKCLAHLWARIGILKVDMQKRFILLNLIPLVSGELRTTEHRAGFAFCSLKEPKQDYRSGHAQGRHTDVAEGHKNEVPSICAIFSQDSDIWSWFHRFACRTYFLLTVKKFRRCQANEIALRVEFCSDAWIHCPGK